MYPLNNWKYWMALEQEHSLMMIPCQSHASDAIQCKTGYSEVTPCWCRRQWLLEVSAEEAAPVHPPQYIYMYIHSLSSVTMRIIFVHKSSLKKKSQSNQKGRKKTTDGCPICSTHLNLTTRKKEWKRSHTLEGLMPPNAVYRASLPTGIPIPCQSISDNPFTVSCFDYNTWSLLLVHT